MTQSTEQERADFEAWARDRYPSIDLTRDRNDYSKALAKDYWSLWQAARRAPAVPVPQGLREAAQRAHDWMDSQADSQSKGNYHSFDLLCLRQERDALAEALAAAPQPPEAAPDCLTCNDHGAVGNIMNAEPCPDCTMKRGTGCSVSNGETHAAPVVLPEPYDYVEWRERGFSKTHKTALYTEQQVRELLAANGIKVAQ